MISRVVLIPVQIWSDPIWWQFVGDTFPETVFALAWTMVVTFFVQLVGIATGVGTNTSPGIVIQATLRGIAFYDTAAKYQFEHLDSDSRFLT